MHQLGTWTPVRQGGFMVLSFAAAICGFLGEFHCSLDTHTHTPTNGGCCGVEKL